MPSRPVSVCVRNSDGDLFIPCCRYSGGPTTRERIDEMLEQHSHGYMLARARTELILHSPLFSEAHRVRVSDWVVIEGGVPRVYSDERFRERFSPMHHSVTVEPTAFQSSDKGANRNET